MGRMWGWYIKPAGISAMDRLVLRLQELATDLPGRMKAGTMCDSGCSPTLRLMPNSAWRLVSIYREGMSGRKQSAAEM